MVCRCRPLEIAAWRPPTATVVSWVVFTSRYGRCPASAWCTGQHRTPKETSFRGFGRDNAFIPDSFSKHVSLDGLQHRLFRSDNRYDSSANTILYLPNPSFMAFIPRTHADTCEQRRWCAAWRTPPALESRPLSTRIVSTPQPELPALLTFNHILLSPV